MEKIQIRCTGADLLQIDRIVEFQGSLKKLSRENAKKLRNSILKLGFIAPFFVWDDGGEWRLLDGHQRLAVLLKMREEGYDIPLLPVDYIEAENEADAKEKLLYITSQYGEFSTEGVYEFMDGLEINWENLRLSAGEFQFDPMFNQEETIGDDEAPEVQEEVYSQLGEIYQLGEHRLMCGDSTSIDAVERLMDGQKADMVLTDPPYGVSFVGAKGSMYSGGKKLGKNSSEMIKADDLRGEDLSQLFLESITCATISAKDGSAFYIFFAINRSAETLSGLSGIGLEIRNWLIWDKGNVGFHAMGAQYKPNYEAFLYCHKSGKSPAWYGGQKEQTVWRFPVEREGLHPTMKPVSLLSQAINNSSKAGDEILDLFGGSGSTLIACAKTNRQCRMMELDPIYCDVIRRRWTKWATENGKEVGSGRLEPSKTANG